MNVVVVGTGYVGLVTGACLAQTGHRVTCVDTDAKKISLLCQGTMPFFEPGLAECVQANVRRGLLLFTTTLSCVRDETDVIIIAVGTPSLPDGHADLRAVYAVAGELAALIPRYTVIVTKSTVPVGTNQEITTRIAKKYQGDFDVVSCPEFLREGSAVDDFQHPDRVVIGTTSDRARRIMEELFQDIRAEKIFTTRESAELIKYASDAFLATKISFINEIAHICERVGADADEVAYGIGKDHRIGPGFLTAGIGWGGSCFPKDVAALDHLAGANGYDFRLLKSVIHVNNHQRRHFVTIATQALSTLKDSQLAVFGLAFKAGTDDVRESAALDIIRMVAEEGAIIRGFDYAAMQNARKILGDTIVYADDPYDAARDADAILITTEWPQFRNLDWARMKSVVRRPIIIDGRSLLPVERMEAEFGFEVYSVGRVHSQKTTT